MKTKTNTARDNMLSQRAAAEDQQPFRCVKCGEAVSHVNPRPCKCIRDVARADRPAMPSCGHSACRQNWIDTGHNGCIQLWACQVCGCTDVQETAWISMNTGEPDGGEGPLEQHWCPECCDHTEVDRTATELQEVK